MYKELNVVMLPTKNRSNIQICSNGTLFWHNNPILSTKIGNGELYVTYDDEINNDDWCVLDLGENTRIVQVKSLNSGHSIFTIDIIDGYAQLSNLKKIIATTDTSIHREIRKWGYNSQNESLVIFPQPSQQFIQHYIEEYNKGNIITKVMVEYFIDYEPGNKLCDRKYDKECLKVNTDNTINIKPTKTSWSKEEVIQLLIDFGEHVSLAISGYKLSMIGELHIWNKGKI